MGDVGDQLRFHPFGFQLVLRCHHGNIRQSVQLPGKFPEAAHQILVVHLALQVAAAHPLCSLQQPSEAVGAVQDGSQGGNPPQHCPALAVVCKGNRQHQRQHAAHHNPLPGQGQQGQGLFAQHQALFQESSSNGKAFFHPAPQEHCQGADHLENVLYNPQCEAPKGGDEVENSTDDFQRHRNAAPHNGIAQPMPVPHFYLGGKGKAEADKQHTAAIAQQQHGSQDGGSILRMANDLHRQIAQGNARGQHAPAVQIQGQGIEAPCLYLSAVRLASGNAAQEHGQGGKQHQPQRHPQHQGNTVSCKHPHQFIGHGQLHAIFSQGDFHHQGRVQCLFMVGVAHPAPCPIGNRTPLGIGILLGNQHRAEIFFIFQGREGVAQLQHRLHLVVHPAQHFVVPVLNFIGNVIPVDGEAKVGAGFPLQFKELLRHFAIFPAGPGAGHPLYAPGELLPDGGFQGRKVIFGFQPVQGSQNPQHHAASGSSQQTGGTQQNGNEFHPKCIFHGFASIL